MNTPQLTQDALSALSAQAQDPRLGAGRIQVLDADSGRSLLERAAWRPGETASVMKTITCAAALSTLGPAHRIETRVLRGSRSGEIVLVGGGDVTLSRVPGDGATFYPAPARLDQLAARTLAALGGTPPSRIVLDDSLFAESEWREDQWLEEDRDPGGYIPRISALQTDGDRADPVADDSPRSTDPAGRAGAEFAALLGGDPEIVRGRAEAGAECLASVSSPPVEALVTETLRSSDNALAEALARLAALAAGEDASFAGLERALKAELARFGVPLDGVELLDGSGLSAGIRVPAATVADLLRRARLREGVLGMLDDRLTRSGPEGTLSKTRFTGDNAVVAGAVRGKTGYIESVHSLAGIVRTVGGTDLVFAVFAMGDDLPPDSEAKQAVDDFVTQLHLRGDALLELDAAIVLAD
ncbi:MULTISPECIES: D-alanyl-D-alanine carboxypeptidase/D-alanyl-D-alanine-endopeptidase [unclassified Leucobacter]|uniref:D-alanyl-D-alanine carboxypeptidase/D-alanyl-D-alanine-endopeptidase n=1 Tax=unclassified Leucobacter TaxID=2621730 RepID=UPI00165DB05A|nr:MULTISPECIES: D-alanyl-D-alanine carboxypeptidase [unclassified Leucobacter]MBC9928367.1 D-alanyl-D-alanine carboxypeptidase [Leucobacter sp. cx-169]MBC9936118.1 D-alanyl-D-alanine carboxypeptidase [Leucobacter sp. cx-87]